MDLENIGESTDKIPVEMNYRIIELFSDGLYSSPNKAFEELVCNSYDAEASRVAVFMPSDLTNKNSKIWVCDNGTGMDGNGLKDLWKIGKTKKREKGYKSSRIQIGQFGIGKLATYVLARKLTHITKSKNGDFLAVTMDYERINPASEGTEKIMLDQRKLTEEQVKEVLEPLISINGTKLIDFELWGKNAEKTWTFAIMSDLRTDRTIGIKEGRLKWILSTALPMSPGFNLFYNGSRIQSSKVSERLIDKWVMGKEDDVVKRESYGLRQVNGKYYVDLPNMKNIHGEIRLYEDSLVKGKSAETGRSHGIFLMIKGRLINTENPLLNGMEELNHAAFNRIQIIVNADELDKYLISNRESIKNSIEYKELVKYLNQKFNQAKGRFDRWCDEKYSEPTFSDKIVNTSPFYSKVPLHDVAQKYFSKAIDSPFLIEFPKDITEDEGKKIVEELDSSITNPDKQVINDYSLDNDLCINDPIAKLDMKSGKIQINTHHPFYITFLSDLKGKTNLPFSLIATNEVLTEAALIEKGVDIKIVRDVMKRRDLVFRDFSKMKKPDIFMAALLLKNSLSDPTGLQDALYNCFDCLGFEIEKMGGNGEPEGKAKATLGIWSGEKQDYSFTYEAKSTAKEKIKAETAKISHCQLHKNNCEANYAVEVAIDFEGADDPESTVNKLAVSHGVTLIRARDLWKLMINAIPKQLNHKDFKEFLESCHTVIETSEWIDKFCERLVKKKPYKEVLEGIFELMRADPKEAPTLEAVRQLKGLRDYTTNEIKEMIKTLELLIPGLINLEGSKARILLPPDKILESLDRLVEDQAPPEFKRKYLEAFENKLNKN